MKILICINSLSSGGAEVFVKNLAIALHNERHEVRVFTYCGAIDHRGVELDKELTENGIMHVSPLIRKNVFKVFVPIFLRREILCFQPDVVHSHLEQTDMFVALAVHLCRNRPRLVRTIHNVYVPTALPSWAHRWLAETFDASVACGEAVLNEYPHLGTNAAAIDNGINLYEFAPTISSDEMRRKLKISHSTPILVNVGSMAIRNGQLQKGQDILIRALARLKDHDWKMLFLGDGEKRKELESLSTDLRIRDRCIFLGRVSDPANYVYTCDLVVMPSRFEGLSIGCIEAACAGKPIIASNITAFNPFRRASTIYFPSEDSDSLAEAIETALLSISSLKSSAIDEVNSYREIFSIKATSKKYLSTYRQQIHET